MGKEISFSDYIIVLTSTYDLVIFNPVYSNVLGLYLNIEDKKPIRELTLINGCLTVHYIDGEIEIIDENVLSIEIDDKSIRRRLNSTIEGNLLKYDKEDAIYYNLNILKAFDYSLTRDSKKRKRSF